MQLEYQALMQQELTLTSTVVASSNQLSAELNDEVIVLNLQTGTYFGLSDVAARIWSLIQQPITCADIAAVIFEEFEMELGEIKADVMRFLQKMKTLELLDVRE